MCLLFPLRASNLNDSAKTNSDGIFPASNALARQENYHSQKQPPPPPKRQWNPVSFCCQFCSSWGTCQSSISVNRRRLAADKPRFWPAHPAASCHSSGVAQCVEPAGRRQRLLQQLYGGGHPSFGRKPREGTQSRLSSTYFPPVLVSFSLKPANANTDRH